MASNGGPAVPPRDPVLVVPPRDSGMVVPSNGAVAPAAGGTVVPPGGTVVPPSGTVVPQPKPRPPTPNDDDEEYSGSESFNLHTAIVNNDLDALKQACDAGADVNEKFTDEDDPNHAGMTPLSLSAALNHLDQVKMLIERKANVNATFAALKTTALMTSSYHGHVEIVRLLVASGADARAVDLQGSNALGYCLGGCASAVTDDRLAIVRILISAGVDVNQRNVLGMNALLLVAGCGNAPLTRIVLDAGAQPNEPNNFGHTPLFLSVIAKRSLINNLLSGHGPTPLYGLNRRNLDQTLKDWAANHRDALGANAKVDDAQLEKIGQFMMGVGERVVPGETATSTDDQDATEKLISSVVKYRQDNASAEKTSTKKSGVMDTLLSCGGRRSKQAKSTKSTLGDKPGTTHAAPPPSNDPHEVKVQAVCDSFTQVIRMLLDAGCKIDIGDKAFGITALDTAIISGDTESTVLMTVAGGDPDHLMKVLALTDLYKHITTSFDKKKVKDLLANDHYLDVNGSFTKLGIAKKSEEVQKEEAADGFERGDEGLTPLAVCAKSQDSRPIEIMKMLVKQGADVNKIGPGGRSPLGESARLGNVYMVKFVVSLGANIEQPNPGFKNATPVVMAAMARRTDVVVYLMGAGAKIDAKMSDDRTALDKALEGSDMNMIDTLLSNADLKKNFTDPQSMSYKMASMYAEPNRNIQAILDTISANVQALDDRDKKNAAKAQEKAKQEAEALKSKLDEMRSKTSAFLSGSPPSKNDSTKKSSKPVTNQTPQRPPPSSQPPPPVSVNDVQLQQQPAPVPVPQPRKSAPVATASDEDSSEQESESESESESEESDTENHPAASTPARRATNDSGPPARQQQLQQQQPKQKQQQPPVKNSAVDGDEDDDDEEEDEDNDGPPLPPRRPPPADDNEDDDDDEEEEESEEEEGGRAPHQVITKTVVISQPHTVTSSEVHHETTKASNGVVTSSRTTTTTTTKRTVVASGAVVQTINQAQIVQAGNGEEDDDSEEEEDEEEEESEEEGTGVADVNSNMGKIQLQAQPSRLTAATDI